MIQSLSNKYKSHSAWMMLIIFYCQLLWPAMSMGMKNGINNVSKSYNITSFQKDSKFSNPNNTLNVLNKIRYPTKILNHKINKLTLKMPSIPLASQKLNIGGPSAPEASSFKAVGSNNLVNLATGDFSYSVPLLDVGGYPVNLFYSGGVTMEQEASWVGLGWNINPGTVNRNMRGVPDDFNGTDSLKQEQNIKPNRTWGGELGADVEFIGLKKPDLSVALGASIGFSYNNYLGPALELGNKVSLSISTAENVKGEKSAPTSLGLTAALGAKLSSRSGLTFSPSLNANIALGYGRVQGGVGLSTSYNSRTGIKDLNITGEVKYSSNILKDKPYGAAASSTLNRYTKLSGSTTITFAKPSYLPALRMPMQNTNYSGQVELGGSFWGIRGSGTAQGYYSESVVPDEFKTMYKPIVGYIYSENAMNNTNAVMDFNRLGDAEVTPNTPIISAPQYNYDVFSIQGEGTGGSIRAYRGDMGFVRDNVTTSKEKNVSVGVDIAPLFHYGVNVNVIKTPTRVGGWEDGNNKLKQTLAFKPKQNNSSFENVYFKNPGESTVSNTDLINTIGGDNLVRFKIGGSSVTPTIEPLLEQFDKRTITTKGAALPINNTISLPNRDKRTQVITMLNAFDASNIGLDKSIINTPGNFDGSNNLIKIPLPRIDNMKKSHHISEIDVLEQNGMRYVYGLPVYSIRQKDFTFSVDALPTNANNNLVSYTVSEPTIYSEHMGNKARLDGFVQTQETPGYASSFLLTGLLSPDYVDVSNDGITEDDLGSAVKFGYNKSDMNHKWRTPRNNTAARIAHFNDGIRTEKKDNKATISSGEREVWYLSTIESKSMIAIFKTAIRNDAKGVNSDLDGTINANENANKRLAQIDLYTKSEIKTKGYANAKPIKSVVFNYDYSLCNGTPDNASGGKLTLKSIYFSYNGQPKSNKDKYVFNYGNITSQNDNPSYSYNASDRWGTYKPALDSLGAANNISGLSNLDYPYTLNGNNDKAKDDSYACAWSLKKILLPSGGQMEVQYEADDYGYVQNRRACNMMSIAGLGNSTNFSANSNMYSGTNSAYDNNFVYIQLKQPLISTAPDKQRQEIYAKYLDGMNQVNGKLQLALKLQVYMPKGLEPLTVYPEYDDYGVCPNSANYMYVHLKTTDGSPLVTGSLGFLTENIPGQAFEGYDVDVDGVAAFVQVAGAMLNNLKNAFKDVNQQMRSAPKGRDISLANSFIRLASPTKTKYGGGVRVKSVRVRDNWDKMKGQYVSVYGQDYEYSTTENINGVPSIISSGVASYEPGIGSEENPFREILSFSNQMPLASAQYGAIEMPMLEGLYPSPNVVYSKVTVRSIHRKGTHGDSTVRSGIGKQVTEFYTAKDYPSYSSFTPMNSVDYKKNPFLSFFYKEIINRRTISQGFLVETNDMHGKMKSQIAYSESDENTPLSASYHTYKNTGKNGLNDKVDFIYNNQSGAVSAGMMGVDMELMTDVREFSVKSNGLNGQGQVDIFLIPIPLPPFAYPLSVPTYFPLKTYVENTYRAVTCTKLINYHAIDDSVIVMDKGSIVSTKTTAYDAETGTPLVTKTANEFNDPIYNVSYPAHWAYSGLGLAYKNIGRSFTGVSFNSGKISLPQATQDEAFESGDELYVTKQSGSSSTCVAVSTPVYKLWAFDKNKNTTALTVPVKDLLFMDSIGRLYTMSSADITIVRSGKRNNVVLTVSTATAMQNPIQNGVLQINNTANIVSAAAMAFKEKWQTDADVFKRYKTIDGINLIANGNFTYGLTNFNTGYFYNNTSNTISGELTVRTNPNSWNPSFLNCSDHTTGNGNLLIVNGSTAAPFSSASQICSQTVNVIPNTTYTISFWANSLYNANPSNIAVQINNITLGTSLQLSSTTCMWTQKSYTWNSQNNTTAQLTLFDLNTLVGGNDFAIDDIFFGIGNECTKLEVEDCSGYLEKSINPYVKGLLGNYKPYRSYTYYGDRNETDPSITTTIRKNGYLQSFANYWNFNTSNNLIPNETNTKWVWNSELTKVNSKGQELETKDALNRYTAAQYGFFKNMPVAMTQNARYGESFAEGFEDFNYKERINTGVQDSCLNNKYVSFLQANDAVIVYPNSIMNGHSGAGALKINANVASIETLKIANKNIDQYNFNITNDTSKTLMVPGGNFIIESAPSPIQNNTIQYPLFSNFGMNSYQGINISTPGTYGSFNYSTEQYFEVINSGIYRVSSLYHARSDFPNSGTSNYKWEISSIETQMTVPQIPISFLSSTNGGEYFANESKDVCLQIGKYKLRASWGGFQWNSCGFPCGPGLTTYNYQIDLNIPLISYKNTSTQNGCIKSLPIVTTDSMRNPNFCLIPSKRMQFSAWVREDCLIPCTKTDYTNSNIEIWANGAKLISQMATNGPDYNIKRTGNIIDGWQKIEGEFTIPIGATTAEIRFINSNTAPMYVDDIRIHPFNANMKSYVYDPRTLRLSAELDENNYASFYEYDEEGQLVRVKKETIQGIKTIKETRSAKQKLVTDVQ